jgi:phospholipid-binding lipoprotein MlaA
LATGSRILVAALALAMLAGCATGNPDAADDDYGPSDPLESYNRVMFDINQTIDGVLLKPAAILYDGILPEWGQERVTNVLNNLGEPVNFANNLLQGEIERAGITLGRFVINSTIGILGVFEVAEDWGLPRSPEDFGQTLAVWGVGDQPYLMLPLFGPSNPRDAIGLVVDWLLDPFTYIFNSEQRLARTATRGVSLRAENIENLETLEETSLDFYAAMRELYTQYRDNEIRNGDLPPPIPIPSITLEDFADDEMEQIAETQN